MARSTYGGEIQIDNTAPDFPKEWGADEMVRARTRKTSGDSQWINAQGLRTTFDENAPNHTAVVMDQDALQQALIARMVTRWTLRRAVLDANGDPVMNPNGRPAQEPIPLPADPNARMEVLQTLHADDVAYIANKIAEAMAAPMSEAAQQDFLPTASAPISES